MTSRRRLLLVALLVVLGLAAAACGSGGGEAATTTSTSESTTTTTEADETTTSTDEPAETSEDTASSGESAEGSLPTVEQIEAMDDFCTVWTTGESTSAIGFDVVTASPEEIENTARAVNALLVQGIATAPEAIKADFTAMAEVSQALFALLAEYEYDVAALSQAAATDEGLGTRMEEIYDPGIEDRIANVEAWVAANC